jgi:hypothetical protein
MKRGFAGQYNTPCVIIEEGDDFQTVIDECENIGAYFQEGPDDYEDQVFVVQFPGRPKEVYSRNALKRSLP